MSNLTDFFASGSKKYFEAEVSGNVNKFEDFTVLPNGKITDSSNIVQTNRILENIDYANSDDGLKVIWIDNKMLRIYQDALDKSLLKLEIIDIDTTNATINIVSSVSHDTGVDSAYLYVWSDGTYILVKVNNELHSFKWDGNSLSYLASKTDVSWSNSYYYYIIDGVIENGVGVMVDGNDIHRFELTDTAINWVKTDNEIPYGYENIYLGKLDGKHYIQIINYNYLVEITLNSADYTQSSINAIDVNTTISKYNINKLLPNGYVVSLDNIENKIKISWYELVNPDNYGEIEILNVSGGVMHGGYEHTMPFYTIYLEGDSLIIPAINNMAVDLCKIDINPSLNVFEMEVLKNSLNGIIDNDSAHTRVSIYKTTDYILYSTYTYSTNYDTIYNIVEDNGVGFNGIIDGFVLENATDGQIVKIYTDTVFYKDVDNILQIGEKTPNGFIKLSTGYLAPIK